MKIAKNYCRKNIHLVTKDHKWVFPYPIENGLAYGNMFPTNDEVANEIRKINNPVGEVLVGTFVFTNPEYWVAKGIFSLFD